MSLGYKFPKFYALMDRWFFESEKNSPLSNLGIEMMDIQSLHKNAIVLDLACGTGTVTLWMAQHRPDIHVVGLDLAEDMIIKAKSESKKLGVPNVSFLCQSALTVTEEEIFAVSTAIEAQNRGIDMIVSSYGFSAMSNYEEIFEKTVNLLAPNGRYVIMDLHYPTRNWLSLFMTHFIDKWLWGSNQLNRVWEVMSNKLENFEKHEQAFKLYGFVPAVFFVAKGIKT